MESLAIHTSLLPLDMRFGVLGGLELTMKAALNGDLRNLVILVSRILISLQMADITKYRKFPVCRCGPSCQILYGVLG